MNELDDNRFDQIFKQRIGEELPEFEEKAWLLMEQKLNRQQKMLWLRYASIILVFFTAGVGAYFLYQHPLKNAQTAKTKTAETTNIIANKPHSPATKQKTDTELVTGRFVRPTQLSSSAKKRIARTTAPNTDMVINELSTVVSLAPHKNTAGKPLALRLAPAALPTPQTIELATQKNIALKRNLPISLSLAIAPNINSTSSYLSGRGALAVGLGIGIALNKNLALQTGINYGSKNYNAGAGDYTFRNNAVRSIIKNIDASCEVLEVPLLVAYNFADNPKRNITLSAGLSSYFMLKEDYRYSYIASTGMPDRYYGVKNENQHYFGVLSLAAGYNFKINNSKTSIGIEPFVRIPLGGLGEGQIPLKSTGISLKLNYNLINNK